MWLLANLGEVDSEVDRHTVTTVSMYNTIVWTGFRNADMFKFNQTDVVVYSYTRSTADTVLWAYWGMFNDQDYLASKTGVMAGGFAL